MLSCAIVCVLLYGFVFNELLQRSVYGLLVMMFLGMVRYS